MQNNDVVRAQRARSVLYYSILTAFFGQLTIGIASACNLALSTSSTSVPPGTNVARLSVSLKNNNNAPCAIVLSIHTRAQTSDPTEGPGRTLDNSVHSRIDQQIETEVFREVIALTAKELKIIRTRVRQPADVVRVEVMME